MNMKTKITGIEVLDYNWDYVAITFKIPRDELKCWLIIRDLEKELQFKETDKKVLKKEIKHTSIDRERNIAIIDLIIKKHEGWDKEMASWFVNIKKEDDSLTYNEMNKFKEDTIYWYKWYSFSIIKKEDGSIDISFIPF